MGAPKRLSICYAVLGHNLLSSAGPTRNVLSLAEAMSQWADVTVAFHRVVEPIAPQGYHVVELGPAERGTRCQVDDAAVRGMRLPEFTAYLRAVRRFFEAHRQAYDVVLEKSWLLSGYLAAFCRHQGLPAIVVENIVRVWHEPIQTPHDVMRYTRHWLTRLLVGHYLRRTPCIIAETEALKAALVQRWGIPEARIHVVHLGVNHHLFRSLDQVEARRELGISSEATVLLYAGVLDRTHDLTPVLDAMCEVAEPSLQLHVVGDGAQRDFYVARTRASRAHTVFHGRVPHQGVPRYIAAADLCLAPYDPTAFPHGQVAYATLKIPEYMAGARPVVSVPSGHILELIQPGVSGYLFPNDVPSWRAFFHALPARESLRQMGGAAQERAAAWNWEDVALAYLALCEQVIVRGERRWQ